MCGSFETQARAGIQPELALLKDAIAIEGLGAIEEHFPLHGQERNVKRVEERQSRQAPIDIKIEEHEVGAHWTTAVASMLRSGMAAQWITRIRIEAQNKIVFDRQTAACSPPFAPPA